MNIAESESTFRTNILPLSLPGKLGCYRLSVTGDVTIPPISEIICMGNVKIDTSKQNEIWDTVLEPYPKFTEKGWLWSSGH